MNQHTPCIFIGLFFPKCFLTSHTSLQHSSVIIWGQVSPSLFSWWTLLPVCSPFSLLAMYPRAFALATPLPGNALFLDSLAGSFSHSVHSSKVISLEQPSLIIQAPHQLLSVTSPCLISCTAHSAIWNYVVYLSVYALPSPHIHTWLNVKGCRDLSCSLPNTQHSSWYRVGTLEYLEYVNKCFPRDQARTVILSPCRLMRIT